MIVSPTFELESSLAAPVAGIDEAGRGPWAGPVVAAAVILDRDNIPPGLRDSKTLTEKRREMIAKDIYACAIVGVGVASVDEIDEINILQATFLAMARAEVSLSIQPKTCIVDGSQKPQLKAPTQMIVKGDAKSLSIAAASIIAKTTRDQMMRDLALEHPHYAWEKNKGYGAPAHREGLEAFGVTPHHRKSFAPIHNMLCADS
ncbi:ribonuclease HII [Hyphococcus flavus]|uniref:Ribonuclease HII n=1 Tax=Hyphococcus flavus TaxID=1866326 RepID=A0AAE9ZGQ8_9PROT|nr:ribonuclease HII [Hyphococcus flavus]WDI32272.1 ribonuclease HII [Hyphococcus flavus]